MLDALEDDIARLVERGWSVGIGASGAVDVEALPWRAAGQTWSAFYDPKEAPTPNTDSVLVAPATVAGEGAIVLAIAHGNYKDEGTAYASAAAVVEAATALAVPFLGEADVGPALRRAMFAADERIHAIAERANPPASFLDTCVGRRRDLRGIGASFIAAVATPSHVFVATAGENRAWLVPAEGEPKRLVQPHTLAQTKEGRAMIEADPAQRLDLENVVLRILGFGAVEFELVRAPVGPGDRVVLGNGALRQAPKLAADEPRRACDHLASMMLKSADWLPSTIAIAERR